MDEREVFPREATAVGMKAIEQGIAGIEMTCEDLYARAEAIIRRARGEVECLMQEGYITPVP